MSLNIGTVGGGNACLSLSLSEAHLNVASRRREEEGDGQHEHGDGVEDVLPKVIQIMSAIFMVAPG